MKRCAIVLIVAVLGWSSVGFTADPKWAVDGTMSDACQCSVFCPCEFSSKPTLGHCDDAAILHITKGFYGDVKLDGKRVAVVSQSPHGERLVDTIGNLTFARIYVPEQSSDAETNALAEIVRRVFGSFVKGSARISADEKVEKVKMLVTLEQNRHKIEIPGILSLDLEGILGADGKTPILVKNHPFASYGFSEAVVVGKSNTYTYTGNGMNWNYAGRSASIRSFSLKSE